MCGFQQKAQTKGGMGVRTTMKCAAGISVGDRAASPALSPLCLFSSQPATSGALSTLQFKLLAPPALYQNQLGVLLTCKASARHCVLLADSTSSVIQSSNGRVAMAASSLQKSRTGPYCCNKAVMPFLFLRVYGLSLHCRQVLVNCCF